MDFEQQRRSAAHDQLEFSLRRQFSLIAKRYLESLEDLQYKHDQAFDKLKAALPKEQRGLVELAYFMDDQDFKRIRKRILDASGEARQELLLLIDRFDIQMNGNKF